MQFTNALLLAAFASGISAQLPAAAANLPPCSLACLTKAFASNDVEITDVASQCGAKKQAIQEDATPCVLKACSIQDAMKTETITNQICQEAQSAPASSAAPSEAAPSSTEAAPSSTDEATSATEAPSSTEEAPSATEAAPSSTEVASSTEIVSCSTLTVAASSATEAPASSAASIAEAPSSAVSSASSVVAKPTSSTPSSTSSAPVEQFTGAATKAQAGMGMLIGAVAVAMAL